MQGLTGYQLKRTCFLMPISLPDIKEQIKIGKYFTSLDNLITLHQRKEKDFKNQLQTKNIE